MKNGPNEAISNFTLKLWKRTSLQNSGQIKFLSQNFFGKSAAMRTQQPHCVAVYRILWLDILIILWVKSSQKANSRSTIFDLKIYVFCILMLTFSKIISMKSDINIRIRRRNVQTSLQIKIQLEFIYLFSTVCYHVHFAYDFWLQAT